MTEIERQILKNQRALLEAMTQLLMHNGKPVSGNAECRQRAAETAELLRTTNPKGTAE